MRPITPLFAAAILVLAASVSLCAADPASTPESSAASAPSEASPETPDAPGDTAPATAQPAETAEPAEPEIAQSEASSPPAAEETTPAPSATASEPASPATPQVITAQIDPELALRLSLLEKTLLAQAQGQHEIYSETSRLLMFFGSACVAMGLIAMIAAVFLMNRTLASVSAITAQVAHGNTPQALPGGASAILPASSAPATGFEKVQASGQRFQGRMTSLEQRLEELEHLAGHTTPAGDQAATSLSTAEPVVEEIASPPRRTIPVAAILVRKSETLMNLGKLHEAIAALDEAAQQGGDQSEVHLARGRVLEKLGRLGDALQSYELAVNSDESNTAALLMKAGVLNRQERFDEALSCYERALAVHRTSN